MKKTILATALAFATAGCAYDAPPPALTPPDRAELADALAGRVEERTVSCVNQRNLGGNRSIGEGVILFEGRTSGLVYVNRPPAGCPEIRPGRALVVRSPSSQLCRGEIVQVIDPMNGMGYGSCGLGDFTPYRRIAQRR